jgi:hypothetical protein
VTGAVVITAASVAKEAGVARLFYWWGRKVVCPVGRASSRTREALLVEVSQFDPRLGGLDRDGDRRREKREGPGPNGRIQVVLAPYLGMTVLVDLFSGPLQRSASVNPMRAVDGIHLGSILRRPTESKGTPAQIRRSISQLSW